MFLAMEYIEHGDLGSYLAQPLPEDEVRKITFQVVEGLLCLHNNDFVHRDIKPKVREFFRKIFTNTQLMSIEHLCYSTGPGMACQTW